MAKGYRIRDQFGVYFLTLTVVGWVDVFARQLYRDLFVVSLRHCCDHKGLRLHAYVVMSNRA